MYNDEVDYLRKMLLEVDMDIARIEKNHHLETKEEQKEAEERLLFLYERRKEVKSSLSRAMMRDMESKSHGGRGV